MPYTKEQCAAFAAMEREGKTVPADWRQHCRTDDADPLMQVKRFDRGELRGQIVKTDEGYLRGDAIVTRTGVFTYRLPDGTVRKELRHPDDVFSKESMDSLKMLPVTDTHPYHHGGIVTKDNAAEVQIGVTGETVYPDGRFLLTSIQISRADGIQSINSGRRELSCGYLCDLERVDGVWDGETYIHRQRNIKYNHVAIVDRARAGDTARLNLDTGDAIQTDEDQNMTTPNLLQVVLDGISYQAAPEVANALTKSKARVDELEGELKTTKDSLKAKSDEFDSLKAKNDEAAAELEKLKKADNSAEIQQAVKRRIELLTSAARVLDEEGMKKLDEASDRDIMVAVINAKHQDVKLDEKDDKGEYKISDVYVQARFDAIIESLPKDDAAAKQRQAAFSRQTQDGKGGDVPDSNKARTDAFDALKNMHKREGQDGSKQATKQAAAS